LTNLGSPHIPLSSTGEAVRRSSTVFGILAVILLTAPTLGADFPARKAGLWEVTIMGANPLEVRQCSDPASDEAIAQASFGLSDNCVKREVQKAGGTITITSVCKSASNTAISRIVITGSLESKYTMIVANHAPGNSI
jgi:Protein of unknown function (DUF3617)